MKLDYRRSYRNWRS